MSGPLVINLRIAWRECEPDGAVCSGCGDVIYLRQKRAVAIICKGREEPLEISLCQACFGLLPS